MTVYETVGSNQMQAWTTEMHYKCGELIATASRYKDDGPLAPWTITIRLDGTTILAICAGDRSPADVVASVFAEVVPLREELDALYAPAIAARERYGAALAEIKKRFA